MSKPTTFTVHFRNEMTGHQRFIGTFASRELADAYVECEVKRARSFATFTVWSGTPRAPCGAVGAERRGEA